MTISGFVLLIGLTHIKRHIGFANEKENVAATSELQIMSFNINLGKYLHDKNSIKKEKKQADFVASTNLKEMDIICAQECNLYPRKLFSNWLPDFNAFAEKNQLTTIYSKYPIINKGYIKLASNYEQCAWADIKTPENIIRVYSVHLYTNRVSKHADKILEQSGFEEEEAWSDIKYMFSSFSKGAKTRAEETAKIIAHIKKSPYPVVVCGDLNDTPESYTYNRMKDHLKDSFVEAAKGLGYSYAGSIPMLRIDYIMVDPKFTVFDHQVIHKKFSDHYPIISTIGIAK